MGTEVFKATGIPISVGIAPTKALTKVANRVAKKYPIESHYYNGKTEVICNPHGYIDELYNGFNKELIIEF